MHRRKFITLLSLAGISAVGLLFSKLPIKRKTKDFLKSILHFLQPTFALPEEGNNVSVETALNSRCTSDYSGNPEKYHWGMFDKTKKLSDEQIRKIITLARIPFFSDQKVKIQSEHNMLTFVVQNHLSGILKDWMMIESGMQQQAVGLVCAALGVGMVFNNLGKDGTPISDTENANINIKLDPMKPTYNGSFWSNLPPAGRKPWQTGNLLDPVRDGDKPLIKALTNLKIDNSGSTPLTEASISQLLWAARGKTPHLYNSKPWGMTIPTWAGNQHISSVYLISNNKLSKYINWDNDKPTHALLELNEIDPLAFDNMAKSFSAHDKFIILAKNENYMRAFWEVGYQLLNLLLQAHALDISYQAILLDETQKTMLERIGVREPVAILGTWTN